jgi:lysozyme
MKFDDAYNQHITHLKEGRLASLAAAGLLATAGATGIAQGATKAPSQPSYSQSSQKTPDRVILTATKDFTAKHEGFREKAYLDTKGIPTIGYGTNLKEVGNLTKLRQMGYDPKKLLNKTQTIKESDAKQLLESGLMLAISHARTYLPNFDSQPLTVKVILTDMAYNLGPNRLAKFEDFKAALLKNNYNQAKREMIDSAWFKQVGNRSRKLVDMMGNVRKV